MEVMNLGIGLQSKFQLKDGALSIKKGDVSQVTIKERMADNEAKVVWKGQQVAVTFDGPIPAGDRVFVEVAKLNEKGQMVVRPIKDTPTETLSKTVDTLLSRLGFDPSTHTELREAVKQIFSNGGSVSKDSLVNLQDFLKNDSGTQAEKLETIKIMQQKNIEFTKVQLNAVNIALHGDTLTESLSDLMEGVIDFQTPIAQGENLNLATDIKKALQIQLAGKERIMQALSDFEGSIDIKEAVQQESNLSSISAILQTKEMPTELKDKINLAIQEAQKLEQIGTEKLGSALQSFIQEPKAMGDLENARYMLADANPQHQKMAEQYLMNEAVQLLPLDSKNVLVTEITKKFSQMSLDFRQVTQDMSRNLEATTSLINTKSAVPAQQILEATINNLDKAILKGDFMLYTDMDTEKKVLVASSRLAEANNLLSKGNFDEANQIVKEVKAGLEKMTFNPSDSRVKHFVSEQEQLTSKSMLEKVIQLSLDHESGARGIFEKLKGMGLTHEVDVARSMVDNQEIPQNLKSILVKMAETNDSQSKVVQALANITGQQLLNKQDTSGVQNVILQIPTLLNKQVENVKIFVNSQKKSEKIDWENCSLYFVLETKKLGDVGIQISAVNRNLSITIKNNRETLQKIIKPLTDSARDRLQEIGYKVGTIQYKPFSVKTEAKMVQAEKPVEDKKEKGFDFSI
ncbi:hypothetical protein [Neobacillus sp. PS3-40]|uniref:hypothetical protein n=1 Tax=Neobacillus sp. PS3-40 TaxID=3070679 RepID=UPI0027E071C6|nr:hypothetical protein [Neobacillus sp. PS3-40]WML46072.1 hypothetical protein RCG20_09370 [Neobacillus sp. PS3-40]